MTGGFDKAKWIQLPRNIIVGHGTIDETYDVIDDRKEIHNALIITSPTTKDIAGDTVRNILQENSVETHTEVVEEAGFNAIDQTEKTARKEEPDILLGVGGGVPIDTAKVTSKKTGTPFASIPTAASHDGITSSRASIPDGKKRHSIEANPPLAVIADTTILSNAPFRLTKSGCADIIANKTAVLDWKLARRLQDSGYSRYAVALSEMTSEILLEHSDSIKPGLEESSWIVVKALFSSGVAMSIAGTSRPASGSEHKFSHALDRIDHTRALHGEQCGVGTIMSMYLHGGDWREIRTALKTIGAPVNADQLNFSEDEIIEALVTAKEIRPNRYTILEGLTEKAARKVATETAVI